MKNKCYARWTLLCGMNSIPERNYLSYDTLENNDEEENLLVLSSGLASPESIAIKKDQFMHLTIRARELVEIISYPPDGAYTQVHGNLTVRSLKKFLRKTKRWTRREIKKVFRELELLGSDIFLK